MKWKQRRGGSITEEIDPSSLSGYGYDNEKALSGRYLTNFLQQSCWNDQLDQISIVWDYVPAFNELKRYGHLDEVEGTRACRRLVKAPVVWDQVGNSLWKSLKALGEDSQLSMNSSNTELSKYELCGEEDFEDDGSADGRYFQDIAFSTNMFGRPRVSHESFCAPRSFSTSDSAWDQCSCTHCKSDLLRSHSGPANVQDRKRSGSISSNRARALGANCANALRRAFGMLGDKRDSCSASQNPIR